MTQIQFNCAFILQLSVVNCLLLTNHLIANGYQLEIEGDPVELPNTPNSMSRVQPIGSSPSSSSSSSSTVGVSYATLVTSKRVSLPRTTRSITASSTTRLPSLHTSSSITSSMAPSTSVPIATKPSIMLSPDTIVHDKEFVSPRVTIGLICEPNETVMIANFTSPFRGIMGAGSHESGDSSNNKCRLFGQGARIYELRIAHNSTDCGTQLDSDRGSIFNTLFIRFHSSLELGGDIVKNIMCKMSLGDVLVGKQRQQQTAAKLRQSRPK